MPEEIRFELPGRVLAAREWGARDGRPVLALHGWLDNAASFDLLAPKLTGCRVVALDLAGHGCSDARSADGHYTLQAEVADLYEVAEQLGWQRPSLLGHSRGAAVATLYAGAFPERVDTLILIEGGIPIFSEAGTAPDDLATFVTQSRALRSKTGRVFADRETALEERANGFSPITLDAARILATRSLREVEGGWRWHADQRLKARSAQRLTPEQASAFATRVAAPTLALLADRSPFAHRPDYRDMLSRIANIRIVDLEGGHHLHLEGAEDAIAREVLAFLQR